jgi:hypothetical protein
MSVTPYLMLEAAVEERRRDLVATAGARRRHARKTQIEVPASAEVVHAGRLARLRHARTA